MVRHKAELHYPAAARGLGLGEQGCIAPVLIGPGGVPEDVPVKGCPAVFHPSTVDSLLRWRWRPLRIGGSSLPVQTRIRVVFRE